MTVSATSRRAFLAATTLAATAAPNAADAASDAGYERAVARTWRPFETRITERHALQRELVRYATLAPSSHNTQCWKFELERDRISLVPDFARRLATVDPDDHHLYVSLGCATENLVQAALARGLRGTVEFDARSAGAVRVALEPAKPLESALFGAIPTRQCTRGPYDGRPISTADLRLLEDAGRGRGVRSLLLTDRNRIENVLAYVVDGNTKQLHDPAFVAELRRWIRFNDRDAMATGRRLELACFGWPAGAALAR